MTVKLPAWEVTCLLGLYRLWGLGLGFKLESPLSRPHGFI